MKITNKTRHKIIANKTIVPISLSDQSFGLLRYKKPVPMLFRTRFGIHTFGMKYSIDILIINKRKQVVTIKENLMPNRIFVWNPTYETVLELPTGTIKKTKTEIGDIVTFLD